MNEVTHSYIDHLRSRFGRRIYRKKPIEIEAYQMNEDFHVKTMEGVMRGKKNDYIIVGIKGELYPCNEEVFLATYDFVKTDEL